MRWRASCGPSCGPVLVDYPDIKLELSRDNGLRNIVEDGFDAGVRLGESVEKDMVAVRIGPDWRLVAVASPGYFAAHPVPEHPQELVAHRLHQHAPDHGRRALRLGVREGRAGASRQGRRAADLQHLLRHGRCGVERLRHRLRPRGPRRAARRSGACARCSTTGPRCSPGTTSTTRADARPLPRSMSSSMLFDTERLEAIPASRRRQRMSRRGQTCPANDRFPDKRVRLTRVRRP